MNLKFIDDRWRTDDHSVHIYEKGDYVKMMDNAYTLSDLEEIVAKMKELQGK